MNDDDFEKIINKAIEGIPAEFKEKMENVSIIFADHPTAEQLRSVYSTDRNRLLLGLYQGIPKTRRGHYGIGPTLPDKITIFKIPLLRISKSYEEAELNIRKTVIHEIAHHFGMSEEEIEKANTTSD